MVWKGNNKLNSSYKEKVVFSIKQIIVQFNIHNQHHVGLLFFSLFAIIFKERSKC